MECHRYSRPLASAQAHLRTILKLAIAPAMIDGRLIETDFVPVRERPRATRGDGSRWPFPLRRPREAGNHPLSTMACSVRGPRPRAQHRGCASPSPPGHPRAFLAAGQCAWRRAVDGRCSIAGDLSPRIVQSYTQRTRHQVHPFSQSAKASIRYGSPEFGKRVVGPDLANPICQADVKAVSSRTETTLASATARRFYKLVHFPWRAHLQAFRHLPGSARWRSGPNCRPQNRGFGLPNPRPSKAGAF